MPSAKDEERSLVQLGWTKGKDGLWWHPRLEFGWPRGDAMRLENEAADGDARALLLVDG